MAVNRIATLTERMKIITARLAAGNNTDFSFAPGRMTSDLFIKIQGVSDVQQSVLDYLNGIALSINDILTLEQDAPTLALIASSLNTTVSDVLATLSAYIDAWGENFRLTRKTPTKAVGTVKVGTPTLPASDQTIGPGAIISSPGGVQYTTTSSNTLFVATASLDPVYLMFMVTVAVQAVNAGSNGNAESGTVNTIVSGVNGFTFATNDDPIIGGTDLETDADFGARILDRWQAVGRTTKAGIADSITTLVPFVEPKDIYVAYQGDPLQVRRGTDVWIKSGITAQVSETFTAFNDPSHPNAIIPSFKPVLSLLAVSSGSAVLQRDFPSAVAGSVQSLDRFQFSTAPAFPVTIVYTYDMVIRQSQAVYDDPKLAPLSQFQPVDLLSAIRAKILCKEAIAILTAYAITIKVSAGFNPIDVKANVLTAIAAFSNALGLGQQVFRDDIDNAVSTVAGVSHITKNKLFDLLGRSGDQDSITASNNQYVVIQTANISTT